MGSYHTLLLHLIVGSLLCACMRSHHKSAIKFIKVLISTLCLCHRVYYIRICNIVFKDVKVHSHFFCCHVQTVTLVTMQPISDDMLTSSKICIAVAKCEGVLRFIKPSLKAFGVFGVF